MSINAVKIKNVRFSRDNRIIFDHLDLEIPKGKIVAFIGESGVGKTTLLNIISGLLKPDEGHVTVFGKNINLLKKKKLYQCRKKMGVLFQNGGLFAEMNVFDNIAFPLRQHTNLTNEMITILVKLKLELVGLREAIDLMPSELSGGMAKRVALARSLALDPELMMYDEPFAGQDPITMAVLIKLIKSLNSALSITSVIVTHNVIETCAIADIVYLVADKKIKIYGPASELVKSKDPYVTQFIHGRAEGVVPFSNSKKTLKEDILNES